uniref:Trehalase n=1 Tax=Steinernema glaseri TaxID=37863 RepID=A0A1I7YU36_9BILA
MPPLLAAAALVFFASTLVGPLGAATTASEPGVEQAVHVCDASNTKNWQIYCNGPILEAVNHLAIFNDSKSYVDMPIRLSPDETMAAWNKTFGATPPQNVNETELRTFLDEYFSPPGSELVNCTPSDWVPHPPKIMQITDPAYREWALKLHGIWRHLCKQIRPEIAQHPDRYSLLDVPHEFIAPGGRFREFYYWDAYWIIKGLIVSEMYNTTQNMIRNLASMVERFGFVPNGGRVYYLQRSQPPMLIPMVYEYYEATNDKDFLREILPSLEKELDFWHKNRSYTMTIKGTNVTVFQYRTNSNVPRPESFKEDVRTAQTISEAKKPTFWKDKASAAESGWDFSTRWFADHKTLYTIHTTRIIPSDLNALICWNYDILEYLYEQIGNMTASEHYREKRVIFRKALNLVFYNKTMGAWFDYNLDTNEQNTEFYPSIVVPLFTGCYHALNQGKSERLFEYMQDVGAFNFSGGIPSSIIKDSEEQWDFPNGWSPLNHMAIEGLRKSENAQMQDQAYRLAKKWVEGNYRVFQKTNHMWEKYDVIGTIPRPGKGGEYDVQDGFGWTNGAILDLLNTYNDRIKLQRTVPVTKACVAAVPNVLVMAACLLISVMGALMLTQKN